MKHILLSIAIALSLCPAWGETIDYSLETVQSLGLPVLSFFTIEGEMPDFTPVFAPEGGMGIGVGEAKKVPGQLVITLGKDTLYDSGPYVKDESGMKVKVTGNTSAYYASATLPLKIKLEKKADLLFREGKGNKDKEWRLLKDISDLKTQFGLFINQQVGMNWTPQYMECNVFFNGKYYGMFQLIESVKRDPSCRINVSKEGYIIERDPYWWNEDLYFRSSFFNDRRYGWTFKYPEAEEVRDLQLDSIQSMVNQMEQSITEGTYDQYIDTKTFANWLLAHDILGTWDSGGANLYLTKYDGSDTTQFKMETLWDFGSIMKKEANLWSRFHSGNDFYFSQLFSSSNSNFLDAYVLKWNQLKITLSSDVRNFFDGLLNSEHGIAMQNSCDLFRAYTEEEPLDYRTEAEWMINWLEEHIKWMDLQICQMPQPQNIQAIEDNYSDTSYYNLYGTRCTNGNRGMLIQKGRKILIR